MGHLMASADIQAHWEPLVGEIDMGSPDSSLAQGFCDPRPCSRARRESRFEVEWIENRTTTKLSGGTVNPREFSLLCSGCGGVLLVVRFAELNAEVQINIPEVLSVKANEGHSLYEIERILPRKPEKGKEVQAQAKKLYGAATRRNTSSEISSPVRRTDMQGTKPPSRVKTAQVSSGK